MIRISPEIRIDIVQYIIAIPEVIKAVVEKMIFRRGTFQQRSKTFSPTTGTTNSTGEV